MTPTPSTDLPSPELDAFEAFLASHPDDIAVLTETPFGGLLAKVNELGFDGEALLGELGPSGILDRETWIKAVELDDAEFFALTPIEYVERFPEHGAPLLFTVLNAIQLSEEQAALHSVAGGTNLSKKQKIELGVGVGVGGLVAANLLVRGVRLQKAKSAMIEFITKNSGAGSIDRALDDFNTRLPSGVTIEPGVQAKIYRDFLGFYRTDITTDSVLTRLRVEWNAGLGGLIHKFRPPNPAPAPEPVPDHDSSRLSEVISESENEMESEVRDSLASDLSSDANKLELNPVLDGDVHSNLERARVNPEREAADLDGDLQFVSDNPAGLQSVRVALDEKLESQVDRTLARRLTEFSGSNLLHGPNGLIDRADSVEDGMFAGEKSEVMSKLQQAGQSAKEEGSQELSTFKSEAQSRVDAQLQQDELKAKNLADKDVRVAKQELAIDSTAVKEKVENKLENIADDVDSRG